MNYIASGFEMQQKFETLTEAKDAAEFAPWADGRVWEVEENFTGDPRLGGALLEAVFIDGEGWSLNA